MFVLLIEHWLAFLFANGGRACCFVFWISIFYRKWFRQIEQCLLKAGGGIRFRKGNLKLSKIGVEYVSNPEKHEIEDISFFGRSAFQSASGF